MHRHGGVFGAAGAQVITVGIYQRGPVAGRAGHPPEFGGAGVAFDGVQRQAQPPGAFGQPGAPVGQVVDLPPPLRCGLGLPALVQRRPGGRPAGAVRGYFLQHRLAQAVPQVPAVTGLDGAGQRAADRLAVGAGAVAADDFDARVIAQPGFQHVRFAAGQDIDPLPGLGVDQDGRVDLAAAQREVIDAQCPWHGDLRQREPQQNPQRGMP